jgi:hypothetical protein
MFNIFSENVSKRWLLIVHGKMDIVSSSIQLKMGKLGDVWNVKLGRIITSFSYTLIWFINLQSTKRLKVQTTGLRSPKLSPTYTLHWHCKTIEIGLQTLKGIWLENWRCYFLANLKDHWKLWSNFFDRFFSCFVLKIFHFVWYAKDQLPTSHMHNELL